MKKITLILAACMICAASFAQKYGHVNTDEIMKAMPGIDSVEIKILDFQKSLQTVYENMVNELNTKKDKFDREVGTMSSSVRKLKEDELIGIQNRIQEFQMTFRDDLEEEYVRLVNPFEEKVKKAIDDVAKEHRYAYIFNIQYLLYYDNGDDVTPLVKKKLGIK